MGALCPLFFLGEKVMTYSELKRRIKSLGFEEDSTMDEYNEIVIDSVNWALQTIYDDLVYGMLRAYYTRELSTAETPWIPTRPAIITEDTDDDHIIDIPDNLVELVAPLAAYRVWLDDDQTKAIIYWNEFDQKRERILTACLSTVKGVIQPTINGTKWFGIGW